MKRVTSNWLIIIEHNLQWTFVFKVLKKMFFKYQDTKRLLKNNQSDFTGVFPLCSKSLSQDTKSVKLLIQTHRKKWEETSSAYQKLLIELSRINWSVWKHVGITTDSYIHSLVVGAKEPFSMNSLQIGLALVLNFLWIPFWGHYISQNISVIYLTV